ncbi:MAG: aldo/keto reductase [Thermoguttaceae bacterium]
MSDKRSHGISRRKFVYQGGILAGTAVWQGASMAAPASEPGTLPERVLGRTGVSVTIMTLGTAPCGLARPHNPRNVADCVNAAIDLGINAIDTAPAYAVAEEGVGLGLGQRRKQVFLSTKLMADEVAQAEKIFSNSLKMLKTDYVDLLYFHHIPDRNLPIARNPDGVFTWLLKQKKAGKARFVGISGHNQPPKFIDLLDSGEVDVLLTVVNFVDRHTYNFEQKVLPVARKHNVGVVAMKVFGGAKDGNYADPNCPPKLDTQYLDLAVRYALGVPGVATLDIGCHNADQIRKNVAMASRAAPLSDEELARVEALGKRLAASWKDHLGPVAGIARVQDRFA